MTSSTTDTDYAAHVDLLIGMLAQSAALGREIDISMCVSGVEPGRLENRKLRDFVTKTLKISGRDFDRALQLEMIRQEFGSIPRSAMEFVEAYAKKKGITAQYNGVLRLNEIPYIMRPDGNREYISPTLWDTDDFKTLIRTKFHRPISFSELQQELRVRAAELRLEFHGGVINDASEVWYGDVCRNRLWQIMGEIDYRKDATASGQAQLARMVQSCFDCSDGVEFVVAVFNKFIWQVKRKIENLQIYDHLMPVILGAQGIGKSTLVRKLLDPIDELWVMTDFKQLTDNRNISLWKNFVLFLDEMGFASKSDMDTVKNLISANTITRRAMFTNVTQQVIQNATWIGSSNVTSLSESITDSTGNRRYAPIRMLDASNRQVINETDWLSVWRSVDQSAADPMIPFKAVLKRQQETERLKTPVEDWLAQLEPQQAFGGKPLAGRRFRSSDLHTIFREFEDLRYPGLIKTSLPVFVRQMRSSSKQANPRFACIEDGAYVLWELA